MVRKDSSLQSQNPISQAQESVAHAHNAVQQAQTHPTQHMIEQAENSVEHAKVAVHQASDSENQAAVELVEDGLKEDVEALNSLQ